MARFDGTAARKLEFGEFTIRATPGRPGVGGLRLAGRAGLRGPDKYEALELRRRRAQIAARRLLDSMEDGDASGR